MGAIIAVAPPVQRRGKTAERLPDDVIDAVWKQISKGAWASEADDAGNQRTFVKTEGQGNDAKQVPDRDAATARVTIFKRELVRTGKVDEAKEVTSRVYTDSEDRAVFALNLKAKLA